MSHTKHQNTGKAIAKRVADGRGQGRGPNYKPWLRVHEVPSKGKSTRIKGWKTGREHHLLSQLETDYFYMVEWSEQVIDIREQFPLELSETQEIASRCGVVHPTNPKSKEPVVMTTDFVITVGSTLNPVEQARTVKYANDLASERTLQKLEIERIYWEVRGIDWKIVTEQQIPKIVVENVEWIHPRYDLSGYTGLSESSISRIERTVRPMIMSQKKPLAVLTAECDDRLGVPPGTTLTVVRHLLATRQWRININLPIDPSQSLQLLDTKAKE